ncbi:MAG: hypothetical protein PHT88_00515 [Candidatus Moranbacteria bacterium]|nr:hypothetical protein [Candidatus Moranbacteria bacterium]
MEKLSLQKYGWKCVLGSEITYAVCLIGGLLPLRTARGTELHHTLFETLPGFTWINTGSVVLGAIYFFVFAWIFAWYFVWMHNSSLVIQK